MFVGRCVVVGSSVVSCQVLDVVAVAVAVAAFSVGILLLSLFVNAVVSLPLFLLILRHFAPGERMSSLDIN